jgi:hypothetical protein
MATTSLVSPRASAAAVEEALAAPSVPETDGHPLYRPSEIAISADSGEIFAISRWVTYGHLSASARATVSIKSCTPSCAAGGEKIVSVTLTLSRPVRCGKVTAFGTMRLFNSAPAVAAFGKTVNLASLCPRGAPLAPTDIATVTNLVTSVDGGTLFFNGAHHHIKLLACSGIGQRWPSGDASDPWDYESFKCTAAIRYFVNGGYNDRQQTVWFELAPTGFLNFDFSFSPLGG